MSGIPRRPLGRTGEQVSVIGLGGWHIGIKGVDEALGIRLVRTAIDRGIDFLDNSWDYNEGLSEERMGRALKDGYRQRAFLMTKIDGRTYDEATRQLDTCLRRLQTDMIDLVVVGIGADEVEDKAGADPLPAMQVGRGGVADALAQALLGARAAGIEEVPEAVVALHDRAGPGGAVVPGGCLTGLEHGAQMRPVD